MNIADRLSLLMKETDINLSQLSKGANVPYTTLDGIFKKGCENIKLSTMIKLADYFDISLDYLSGRDDSDFTLSEYKELQSFERYLLYKREKED